MTDVLEKGSVLVGVPSHSVPDVWPDVVGLLQKAMAHGDSRYGLTDVFDALVSGNLHLWVAQEGGRIRSMCIANIVFYPRMKVCYVPYMAGRRVDLLRHKKAFEAYYAEKGCKIVEAWGRKGFTRVLDYEPAHVVLRKRL